MKKQRRANKAPSPGFIWDERRLAASVGIFRNRFGADPVVAVSSPGRTELGGNHTDHQRGKVLAASVDLDMIAVASPNPAGTIRIISDRFPEQFEVRTDELNPRGEEKGTSSALIRGIAAAMVSRGVRVGGFDASVSSMVGIGSGLSSSASFEVLIGTIIIALFGDNAISDLEIAMAGQSAENDFFGKPCGLMDQVACCIGGTLKIDFRNPLSPEIERIHFDPRNFGYELVVVNTGSGHEDLTREYQAITEEMNRVAEFLGVSRCREIDRDVFFGRLPQIRRQCGDRAVLRCMHFFAENDRVDDLFAALRERNFREFLHLVRQSGDSSSKYLQNIYSPSHPRAQALTLALALTEDFLSDFGEGAARVHGGGFAGTIQAYIPAPALPEYKKRMDPVFGRDSVQALILRNVGVRSKSLSAQ